MAEKPLILSSLISLILMGTALAGPVGGTVGAGSAEITGQGSASVAIRQHSQRVVIDWQSFDTHANERVDFYQPNSRAVALNRILSGSPTQFNGSLNANGNVIVMNASGIVFGKDATVDVAGLVATSANISTNDFMKDGTLSFDQIGNTNASIINHGTITAKDAGLVGFVAPNVVNNGTIVAKLGKVQLSSGDSFTLDFYGDGLVAVEASDAVTQQLVNNTGRIEAEGGLIAMTAAQARNAVDNLIANTGIVEAKHVGEQNGRIILSGPDAQIQVSGILDASGEHGGTIHVLGKNIELNGATINASGDRGGGSIRIGGGKQGGENLNKAQSTSIDQTTTITADAQNDGSGGTIVIWSDQETKVAGHLSARGGSQSGDGGFIETSSKEKLEMSASVDTTAAHGKTGMLLLDPTDITIYGSGGPSNGSNFVNTTYLQGLGTNITLTADNDIYLDLNSETLSLGNNLSLNLTAGNNITTLSTGAMHTIGTGGITLSAGNGIIFNHNMGLAANGTGNISLVANAMTLNGNITGNGTLTIQQATDNRSIYVNNWMDDGSMLHLDATELGYIQNGWSQIFMGRATANATMEIGASTWQDPVTFRTGSASIYVDGNVAGTGNASLSFLNNWQTGIRNNAAISTQGSDINFWGVSSENGGSINSNGGNILTQWSNLELRGGTATDFTINSGGGDITVLNVTHNGTYGSTANRTLIMNAGSGAISFGGEIYGDYNMNLMAGSITFGSTIGTTAALGNITLTSTDSIVLPSIRTVAGKTVDADVTGTGNSITASVIATGASGNISLAADDMILNGNLSGTGSLIIKQRTSGRNIYMNSGIDNGTSLHLTSAEIGRFVDGWSNISLGESAYTATSGTFVYNISFSDPTTFNTYVNVDNLHGTGNASFSFPNRHVDWQGGNITTQGGNLSFSGIYKNSNGFINTNGGNFSTTDYSINSAQIDPGVWTSGGNIIIGGLSFYGGPPFVTAANSVRFEAGSGAINFGNAIDVPYSVVANGGSINFNGAWGGSTQLGSVTLTSVNGIMLPSINANNIFVRTTGAASDLTLNSGSVLTASDAGNALTLVAGRNFTNNSGAAALSASNGRWLVYSHNEAADISNGLSADFVQHGCVFGGAPCNPTIPASGNGFVYSTALNVPVVPPVEDSAPDAVKIAMILPQFSTPLVNQGSYLSPGEQSKTEIVNDAVLKDKKDDVNTAKKSELTQSRCLYQLINFDNASQSFGGCI